MITYQPGHLQQRPRALLIASKIHPAPPRRLGLFPRKTLRLLRRCVLSVADGVRDIDAPDLEHVDVEVEFLWKEGKSVFFLGGF